MPEISAKTLKAIGVEPNTLERNVASIQKSLKIEGMSETDIILESGNAFTLFRSFGDASTRISKKVAGLMTIGEDKKKVWNDIKSCLEKAYAENYSTNAIEDSLENRFGQSKRRTTKETLDELAQIEEKLKKFKEIIYGSDQFKTYKRELEIVKKLSTEISILTETEKGQFVEKNSKLGDYMLHSSKASLELLKASQKLIVLINEELFKCNFPNIEKKVNSCINSEDKTVKDATNSTLSSIIPMLPFLRQLNVFSKVIREFEVIAPGYVRENFGDFQELKMTYF